MHLHKHFLSNILRAVMVSHKAEGNIVRLPHMTFNEALERAMVPCFGLKDKLLLARFGLVSSGHARTFYYVWIQVLDRRKVDSVDRDSPTVYERKAAHCCSWRNLPDSLAYCDSVNAWSSERTVVSSGSMASTRQRYARPLGSATDGGIATVVSLTRALHTSVRLTSYRKKR